LILDKSSVVKFSFILTLVFGQSLVMDLSHHSIIASEFFKVFITSQLLSFSLKFKDKTFFQVEVVRVHAHSSKVT
jgi:hypothetical protein